MFDETINNEVQTQLPAVRTQWMLGGTFYDLSSAECICDEMKEYHTDRRTIYKTADGTYIEVVGSDIKAILLQGDTLANELMRWAPQEYQQKFGQTL